MNLMIRKVLELIIFTIFVFFISDYRNKKGMISLVSKKWVLMIKILYAIPVLLYVYVLMLLKNLYISDYIGIFLTLSGTWMVVKAKKDMGKYHTWAGHKLRATRMITGGIYSFIRHPLYTGICLFIFGGLIISSRHNPFNIYITVTAIMVLAFLIVFIVTMAFRESKFLLEEFGEEYIRYREQVHAFIPISRYSLEEGE